MDCSVSRILYRSVHYVPEAQWYLPEAQQFCVNGIMDLAHASRRKICPSDAAPEKSVSRKKHRFIRKIIACASDRMSRRVKHFAHHPSERHPLAVAERPVWFYCKALSDHCGKIFVIIFKISFSLSRPHTGISYFSRSSSTAPIWSKCPCVKSTASGFAPSPRSAR